MIGIGINVGTNLDFAPEEIRAAATSLNEHGGPFGLEQVLLGVLDCLQNTVQELKTKIGQTDLIESLNAVSYLQGRKILVSTGSVRVSGIAQHIATDGSLMVDTLNGQQKIVAGSITLL